jgi:hypothetical protein
MNKILLLLFFMLISQGDLSAQLFKKKDKKEKGRLENLSPQAQHDAYVQMANNQKLLGWFALGLGSSMILGGTAKMMSNGFKDVPKTDIRLIWLPAVGVLTTVGSYFIVKNSKEKRKKAAIILEKESAQLGHPQHVPHCYPTVGIRVSID